MKTLKKTLALLLLAGGFAQAQAQDITVQGERKLNTDFKNYKTYGWLNMDNSNSNSNGQVVEYIYEEPVPASTKRDAKGKSEYVVYSYGFFIPSEDPAMNDALTAAVENEMEGRGYKKSPNPDLLLGYRILDAKSKIKGYNARPTRPTVEAREVHQPADTVSYAVKSGTVFLTMVDAKSGQMVWEGFASGVANNGTIDDPARLKEAMNLIFSKYEFRADKFSVGNR